jgi:hypothetical protein
MPELLRIVEFDAQNQVAVIKDVHDAVNYHRERGSFNFTPGPRLQAAARSAIRYAAGQVVSESHDNGQVTWTTQVTSTSYDDALAKMSTLIAEIESAAGMSNRFLEWRPEGASASKTSYFRIVGPGTWAPSYDWAVWRGAKTITFNVAFPVAPLVSWAPMTFTDNFAVDRLSTDWTFDANSGTLAVSGGALTPTSSGVERVLTHTGRGYTYTDFELVEAIAVGSGGLAATSIGVVGKWLDASNYLTVRATAGTIAILKRDGGVLTSLASTAATITASTNYWLRMRVAGNVVTAEWWTAAPSWGGTPAATVSHTLAGGDATKFGTAIAGRVGIRMDGVGATNGSVADWAVRPWSYSTTSPAVLDLYGVPGDAPARFDLEIGSSGTFTYFFCAGWGRIRTPATTPPMIGIIEAETMTAETVSWTPTADATASGGSKMMATAAGALSPRCTIEIDPQSIYPDDFFDHSLIEIWARVKLASTLVTPRLSVRTFTYTSAATTYGSRGTDETGGMKTLVKPSGGTAWRFVRVGVMHLDNNKRNALLRLQVDGSAAVGSTGEFSLDYLLLLPAQSRVALPTGKTAFSGYPRFSGSVAAVRRLFTYDGRGFVNDGGRGEGVGGSLQLMKPGNNRLAVKLSNLIPDNPDASSTSEDLAVTTSVQVAVTPQSFYARS